MAHGQSIPDLAGGSVGGEGGDRWVSSGLLGRVAGLVHGFTLRKAGDFAGQEAAARLLGATGATRLRLLRQVHGTAVAGSDDPRDLPQADAWVGRPPPGALLGIRTADCLPVLFCHPQSGTLGLAHAGWRGAVAGIAAATLKQMSVPAEEILVALGPAIGPCCYEVGEDVAAAAGRATSHLRKTGGGKYRFDLPGFTRTQLFEAGIRPENLDRIALCTACRTDVLYSYRAEGETGRLCAFQGWRE